MKKSKQQHISTKIRKYTNVLSSKFAKSHNSRTHNNELQQWPLKMHKTLTTTPPNKFSKLPWKTNIFKTKFFAQKLKTLRKQN